MDDKNGYGEGYTNQGEQPYGITGDYSGQNNPYTQQTGTYTQGYTSQTDAYAQGYTQQTDPYGQGYTQQADPYASGYGQNYAASNMGMNMGQPFMPDGYAQQESKGLAIASMVLGIVSLVVGCCASYLGIPTAIAGLITGIISLVQKKGGKGMAIAGVIMSAIAIVFIVIVIILMVASALEAHSAAHSCACRHSRSILLDISDN